MSGVGSDVVALKAVPSTTLADATSLLHNDATPAIYAIKFVSGAEEAANEEVSEYGQYLTVMSRNEQTNQPNNFTFATMPSVNALKTMITIRLIKEKLSRLQTV